MLASPRYLLCVAYFAVPDLKAALDTVTQQGGQRRHPIVIMPQGRFVVVADPHGATFALYQANRSKLRVFSWDRRSGHWPFRQDAAQ
jgi:hypothetical protein